MSNTKTVMSQAANTLVKPLNVEDVFSTYLYEGNGSTQTITNDIDLDGEGGLVWLKNRSVADPHRLHDTVRGISAGYLDTASISSGAPDADEVTSFNSNGFSLGDDGQTNGLGEDMCSWTFRKAPKFFDVVTYTGNGVAGREIAHNLGTTVGCIIIKRTDSTGNWQVTHRGTTNPMKDYLYLNLTGGVYGTNSFFSTSDTTFTLSNGSTHNASGATYVAYLFAHNDGDGGFNGGDIIKCGSYTGNGTDQFIDLGFEPQWVMIKDVSTGGTYHDWCIFDSMRKLDVSGSGNAPLMANLGDAEGGAYASSSYNLVQPTPTGMIVEGTSGPLAVGTNGDTYIYIAIRRGTKVPESGTEVFAVDEGDGTAGYTSNFEVDMALRRGDVTSTGQNQITARLTQAKGMYTDATTSEYNAGGFTFDSNVGWGSSIGINANDYSWMWKRAPGFFDVVAYTGNGASGRTVSHNLGVAPEMVWIKGRNYVTDWAAYHSALGNTKYLIPNTAAAAGTSSLWWNNTSPTATEFTLGNSSRVNNTSSNTYIAYLFASLPGISKVGSYTGDGTTGQTIDCGFTSGARFILIKRTDITSNWFVWDTERGIVSGNDPYLRLNRDLAEGTTQDDVDPQSSGFIVNQGENNLNQSGGTYIFYAIA